MSESHWSPASPRERAACVAVLVALGSCSGGTSPPDETIEVAPGAAAASAVGDTLRFSATARDASGAEIPGVTFTWTSSAPAVAIVDDSGLATALSNGTASIQASAFDAVGAASLDVAQQPAAMSGESGDGQSGLAREPLALPLRVRVLDGRSNPIPGLSVTWEVLGGGGSVAGPVTDGTGYASGTWTLGPTAGPGSARAVAGPASVTFAATALPNGIIEGTVSLTSVFTAPQQAALAAGDASVGTRAETGPSPKRRQGASAATPSATAARVGRAPRASAVPGELLVRVRTANLAVPAVGSPAYRSRGEAERAARTMRAAASRWAQEEPLEVLGASPALAIVRVRVPQGELDAVRRRLLARPEVESVEANARLWTSDVRRTGNRRASTRRPGATAPLRGTTHVPAAAADEPLFPLQAWHYDAIDAFGAWDVTTGSPGVIVAVLDDGIRFDHPDIASNLRSDGYDFVSDESLDACTSGSYSTSMDGDGPDPDPTTPAELELDAVLDCVVGPEPIGGHGLHVAGTIGARAANGEGGVGLAWQVSIRPVRVLASDGGGAAYDVAQGILYAAGLPADNGAGGTVQAASGARIISMSFGGTTLSTTLESAVLAAAAAGSLMVAAAGNDGARLAHYPASYRDVLSVAAFTPDVAPAPYSTRGPTVDLSAPGGELSSAGDRGVWSLRWDFQSGAPVYEELVGTSMAVPHVSGVAALVLAASPGLSMTQLRARLLDHATPHDPALDPDDYGVGLLNASASVRNGVAVPRDTYVWAFDDETGAAYGPMLASVGGGYRLNALPDGAYRVFAGQDRNADGRTGLFGRRWGALGGSTRPLSLTIAQSSIASANFTFGLPIESEPNNSLLAANPMPLGGYAHGVISSTVDADLFRVELDATRTIIVETDARLGACGLAGQVDTVLRILDAGGGLLAENDDVDEQLLRLCSRIVIDLPAGTYYVRVTGFNGRTGQYAVRASDAT
jgi:subtilisin family serine protease